MNTITLRPYQETAVKETRRHFAEIGKRVILCLPTGAGKTVIFSHIAIAAAQKGKRVLILTHRRELYNQASAFVVPGMTVQMVETYHNRMKRQEADPNKDCDLMIIDECHIGNFTKVLAHFDGFVIGATATPIAKPALRTLYQSIVVGPQIAELIAEGSLAACRALKAVGAVKASELETKAGEFTEASQHKAFSETGRFQGYTRHIASAEQRKSIVFCCSIQHTIDVATELANNRGLRVYLAHSKMPKDERELQMDGFKADTRPNAVLVNCGIATTGFDCPDIGRVVVLRATRSVALWLQMVGRGSRPATPDFELWDYGTNIDRLGLWDAPRNWKQVFERPDWVRKASLGMAPSRMCSTCGGFSSAKALVCECCGEAFPLRVKQSPDGSLVEVQTAHSYEGRKLFELLPMEVIVVGRLKGWKQIFIERVLYRINPRALEQFYAAKRYSAGAKAMRLNLVKNGPQPANFVIRFPELAKPQA